LVSAGIETLARGDADYRNDAHPITEFQNNKNVDWLEKVSDEQYRR